MLYEAFYVTFSLSRECYLRKKSPCSPGDNPRSVWRKRHLWEPEARREGESVQSDPKRPLRKSRAIPFLPHTSCVQSGDLCVLEVTGWDKSGPCTEAARGTGSTLLPLVSSLFQC